MFFHIDSHCAGMKKETSHAFLTFEQFSNRDYDRFFSYEKRGIIIRRVE